ncbi:MAG: hypothetical protein Q8P84_08115 [Deltaproteobacteria bacterium]|nr:hypothetical protein [Deltaproteobacteria bacterium]
MKLFSLIFVMGVAVTAVSDLWACPAGKTCPAGADCVANESLCVADSSSGSATSTEPATVKDQMAITFTPPAEGTPLANLSAGATCTVNCTFNPTTVGAKTSTLTVTPDFPFNDIPTAIPMYGEWVVNSLGR